MNITELAGSIWHSEHREVKGQRISGVMTFGEPDVGVVIGRGSADSDGRRLTVSLVAEGDVLEGPWTHETADRTELGGGTVHFVRDNNGDRLTGTWSGVRRERLVPGLVAKFGTWVLTRTKA